MTENLENRIEELERHVQKLQAREGVIAGFNKYLYSIDTGFIDDILDAFSEDAVLDVLNFPPDGVDMHFNGRGEIAPLYERYRSRGLMIGGGHNATNISIVIDEGAVTASLSAYFTTTRPAGVQGGRYEGFLHLEDDGKWRITKLSIISAWGWKAETVKISDPVEAERSFFGGKPASSI